MKEQVKSISVAEMRAWDAYTIKTKVPSKELMRRAAEGVYQSFDWTGHKTGILCGSGNNGGDGYALAGIMKRNGHAVSLIRTSEKASEDGLYYLEEAERSDVGVGLWGDDTDLSAYDVLVDCILGTGFDGVPRGNAREAIEAINRANAYVISVDINSGMNGDTGEAECAVRSDLTVSIGFYKNGMFRGRAKELIGELVNVDIGIVEPPSNLGRGNEK